MPEVAGARHASVRTIRRILELLVLSHTAHLPLGRLVLWLALMRAVGVLPITEGASYVQDKLGAVDDTVRDYTGKPLGEWTEDLRAFMRERPLTGVPLMIGVGYVVARFLRR